MTLREADLAELMRAANRGDAHAYRNLLREAQPGAARVRAARILALWPLPIEDVEDIVQETLLAMHLKRHTWIENRPLLPWVRAIAHNKLVDHLRRSGRGGNTFPSTSSATCSLPTNRIGCQPAGCRGSHRQTQGPATRRCGRHFSRRDKAPARWPSELRHDGRRGSRRAASRLALPLQGIAKRPAMKTDDLIEALVQDASRPRHSPAQRVLGATLLRRPCRGNAVCLCSWCPPRHKQRL